jgi:ABC-2 type transport system ATP-binding protein
VPGFASLTMSVSLRDGNHSAEPLREADLEDPLSHRPVAFSAVEATGLVKRYGEREALRGVDLTADPGELVAIIGPNGAGKTTLLSILAGTVKPDAGKVSSLNGDVGWVPQQAALYRRLTVEENLLLFARLEKREKPHVAVEEMLELTGLRERRGEVVAKLSGGNQQRINIAIGLLARPAVLLLDEPSVGLDPRQRARLWEFVSGLADRGTTVIFSTHDIQEAERYGQRLLVLADGESLFDGSSDGLREAVRGETPEAAGRDFETAFVAFLQHRGH